MSLTMNVTLDRREILSGGVVQVRLVKEIRNGATLVARDYHRFALAPGADIDTVAEVVNAQLAAMGYPAMADDDVDRIKAVASAEWTPEVLAAYESQQAQSQAEVEPAP